MRFRTFICTALMTFAFAVTAYGAEHQAQIISFGIESGEDTVIELTGSKVITDDFSFKVPSGWSGSCVMVPGSDRYEIYDKAAYEEDGSGLLFTIVIYEDVDYEDLQGCSILGFCENKTYILESSYDDFLEDTSSEEYKACSDAYKLLKKSFVSYVKESA